MNNIVHFPDYARSREEAAVWLARLDKGLSAAERAELAVWLDASPANRAELVGFAGLWDDLDRLADLSELFPLERGARAAPRRAIFRWAVAAGVAAVALAAAVIFVQREYSVEAGAAAVVATITRYSTAIGGHERQQLPDGSTLVLNTATEVDTRFSEHSRDVDLIRGEAHFTIAHDTARPFRVHVGDRVLEAVGTAFNVQLKAAGAVELTVTDGTVKVEDEAAGVVVDGAAAVPSRGPVAAAMSVVAGELAFLDPQGVAPRIVELDKDALDALLAWQRGELLFRNTPLAQAVAEFARYKPTAFKLEDDVGRVTVGGLYRVGDLDVFLDALQDLGGDTPIAVQHLPTGEVVLRKALATQ